MQKITLALALLAASVTTAAANTPAYRDSVASAPAHNPTVTITPAVGDAFVVFVLSDGHSLTDLNAGTITDDNGGTYAWQDQAAWEYGSKHKWAKLQVFVRDQQLTNTTATTLSITPGQSDSTAMAIVTAVSGLSTVDSQPPVGGDGVPTTHTVRMIKSMNQPFAANDTPTVPTPGWQTAAFLTTSLTFAVLGNLSNPTGVTAPSSWTARHDIGTVAASQALGLSLGSRDSGFSGTTVTWGSTTASAGKALVVEIQ